MKIDKIVSEKNGRAVVVMEDGLSFPLGNKEVKNLELSEGKELGRQQLEWIFDELVFTRGRNYLVYLLSARDYTVAEMEEKLRKADYPGIVVSRIIQYGIQKRYLDDLRYAQDYIRSHKKGNSVRQMQYKLSEKGIPAAVLECLEAEEDRDGLSRQLLQYYKKKKGTPYERKGKTYQYFLRKGYSPGMVWELLEELCEK